MTASTPNVSTFRAAHTTFVVCDTPKTVDVSLRGEYDLSSTDTSELVIELVADLLVKTPRPVILDLSAVSFFDAAGIKFLLRVHRVAQLAGTTARVHNPTADVRRLFELVGLSTFIDGTSQRQ